MTTTQQQEEELHICGQTGREFDQENPLKGCGETIEEDDENVMIGNISYCLGCYEKRHIMYGERERECEIERMKEMEQYDRYVLWTKENDGKITIHHANDYGDDMLEDMYELLMGGGIDGVYISAVEGGDDCRDQIKMWENREEHICYSWTTKDGADEEFKRRADGRQAGLW